KGLADVFENNISHLSSIDRENDPIPLLRRR
ncbi:MAG: hypothetical protein ACJAY6_003246, partial [Yoonia sp.]